MLADQLAVAPGMDEHERDLAQDEVEVFSTTPSRSLASGLAVARNSASVFGTATPAAFNCRRRSALSARGDGHSRARR